MDKERRKESLSASTRAMERQLNELQLATLRSIEGFGWELKFVRHPLFQDPVPVVFDSSRDHFAIIEQDGTLNENPDINIRD